eukprot:1798626-Rhodomonas_salina.3
MQARSRNLTRRNLILPPPPFCRHARLHRFCSLRGRLQVPGEARSTPLSSSSPLPLFPLSSSPPPPLLWARPPLLWAVQCLTVAESGVCGAGDELIYNYNTQLAAWAAAHLSQRWGALRPLSTRSQLSDRPTLDKTCGPAP